MSLLLLLAGLNPVFYRNLAFSGTTKLTDRERQDALITGELQMIVKGQNSDAAVLSYVQCLRADGTWVKIADVRIVADELAVPVGHYVRFKGNLELYESPTNPGQFDAGQYYAARGIGYVMYRPTVEAYVETIKSLNGVAQALRGRMRSLIERTFPADAAGYVAALLIGDKSAIAEGDKALWQMSGISHMLAISGMHLSLIGMGLYELLKKMRLSPKASVTVSFLALSFYALLTGLSVSTLRAFIMFGYMSGARLAGRQSDRINSLSLAVLLILLDNPLWLLDVSFQLSALAVLGTVIGENAGTLKMACLMFVMPLPLNLYHFGEVSLVGVGLNLLLVPLLPILLIAAFAGLLLPDIAVMPFVWCIRGINACLDGANRGLVMTYIGGTPTVGQLAIAYAGLFIGLILFKRYAHRKRRFFFLLLIPVMLLILKAPREKALTVTMLDVGQGDCVLMTMPNGRTFMTDCGSSNVSQAALRRVVPCLKYEGIGHLDYLALTHMDEDHINGAEEILRLIKSRRTSLSVGALVLPVRETVGEDERRMEKLAAEVGVRVVRGGRGDVFAFGVADGEEDEKGEEEEEDEEEEEEDDDDDDDDDRGDRSHRDGNDNHKDKAVKVTVLSPDRQKSYGSENENSLVLSVSYGETHILLTGDVEGEGEEDLTSYLKTLEETPSYDLLKAAHHGSRYASEAAFLEAADPKVVFISAGAHNRYGHPHEAFLQRLDERQCLYFATKECGALRFKSDGKRQMLSVWRDGAWRAPETAK